MKEFNKAKKIMIKLISIILCYSHLFSSFHLNQSDKIEDIIGFNDFLNSSYNPKATVNINLFNIQDYNLEAKSFNIPIKKTATTLNPLIRNMGLYDAAHLLKRTIIGPTIEENDTLATLNISNAVEYLLRDISDPPPPGEWVNHPFPSSYYNIKTTTSISLHNSELIGEIPSEIGELDSLTYLSLSSNQLTGSVPSSIGNLTNLTDLYLRYNQLSGEIPQAVCDLIGSNNLNMDNILPGNNLTNTCP